MSETPTEPDIPFEEPDTDPAPETPEEDETPGDPSAEPSESEADTAADAEREQEQAIAEQDEQPQGVRDDVDIEQRQKKLFRAADMYVKKVVDALGEDLDGAKPCPLCADFFPGFRFPVMPPAENMAAIRVAIGLEPGDNLPPDNYSRTCTACDGWGFTASGSKVAGKGKLTCYDCQGEGWIPVGNERERGAVTGGNGHAAPIVGALQDHPSHDPPEVERLKQLGYIVVAPTETLPPSDFLGTPTTSTG